jgi:DNA-binding transcriptional ArsR family regulator
MRASGAAATFGALGDETRLRLVTRLSKNGPLSITALADGSHITRQAITKHLRVMEGAGVVKNARQGRESLWQLDRATFDQARRYLDAISSQWEDALERLRKVVES